jgi:arsenate reductase (glutaredoxin)
MAFHNKNKKMLHIYGITTCDSVKKALSWIKENGIQYRFHDFKQEGISAQKINEWLSKLPPETLINKKSTAWRLLTDKEKNIINENSTPEKILSLYPNILKRPIIESKRKLICGFSAAAYTEFLFDK